MIVIDASVWVSLFIASDLYHASSRAWLADWLRDDDFMAAPVLLTAEVTGAIRRRTGDREAVDQVRGYLHAADWLTLIPLDAQRGRSAEEFAATLALRGADATYIAVAAEFDAPLVTWDQEQIERGSTAIRVHTPLTFGRTP